jgi:hypothetical protein
VDKPAVENRLPDPPIRSKAMQNQAAHFLNNPPNTLLNQSLKVLVRAMSTTGPQDYPVPVWIIVAGIAF